MDYKHIEVYEVLTLPNVELFETFKENGLLLTKGNLQVLYSQEYNWFILKIDDFSYGLNKNIPLLASTREPGAARAYVLPTVESYYVIKIHEGSDSVFSKLEDILRDNTDFAYKEGERGDGLPIELGDSTVRIKKIQRDPNARRNYSLAQLIFEGGNSIEKMMVNTAEVIAGGMTKVADTVDTTFVTKKGEEKQEIKVETVSRLAMVNSATAMSTSMSTCYVKGLLSLSATIGQWIAQHFEKSDFQKEVEEIQEKERQRVKRYEQPEGPQVESIFKATVHSINAVWHGMAEALQIITTGFGESTSNVVGRQFGPLAGEVFKAGVGVVGQRVRVPKLPGQKYLRYMNRF